MYTVKKLGNKLHDIKTVYNRLLVCKEKAYHYPPHHYDYMLKQATKILPNFPPKTTPFSWFKKVCTDDHCGTWHMDSNYLQSMIISSYPHTTQIFIPYDISFLKRIMDNGEILQDDIDNLLYQEKGYIFQPEPGDIYYLSAGVIHRSDPLSFEKPHLVLRKWVHRTKNWMDKL